MKFKYDPEDGEAAIAEALQECAFQPQRIGDELDWLGRRGER